MAKAAQTNEKVVNDIIKRYGDVINLKENPALIVEIVRNFGKKLHNDGGLPGGVGPVGPTSHIETVTNAELMKQLLKLSKEIATIKSKLG
ncbi:hypothetical protein HNV11_04620 [Spirosoma taeanense]|uniref:Uncharacterized protein n=1 Tax=Spirosoma taeanense TaxID=2735870 RepID=A0A6M5Y653_9BACT|nr:hypothetical protein [Spirosoma taeanense]QJW88711.1 hypothetical protein HNV11_04620 [Spirosoma taeanense]